MSEISSTLNTDLEHIAMLQERYRCPQFRILVIGRALAGKTTILEKVCGVEKGTLPIISDENGKQIPPSEMHLKPSIERGIHNIEHQITYQGSNFIFHDSPGFEAGSHDEINEVWKFIKRRSNSIELKDQLHAIWYCIPMDSPRPLLSTELEFFNRGTGKVPLVVAFTKFDGQIINEYVNLGDELSNEARWEKARENADKTFQTVYLHKVLNTRFPPKEYVRLEDMDVIENTCSELVEKTADIIDDASLHQLLVSTQMNNLDLCVKAAIKYVLSYRDPLWRKVIIMVLCKFPHFWVDRKDDQDDYNWEGFRQKEPISYSTKQSPSYDIYDQMRRKMACGQHFNYHHEQRFHNPKFYLILKEILPKLSSLFGYDGLSQQQEPKFSATPEACQVLAALNIIAKQSFWIIKPFSESILEALDKFKSAGYVEELKARITYDAMNLYYMDLLQFLCDQIKQF